ncbi:uncharacterized protein LOC126738413 [Anthonomus grandis grandis]|uniref:uncharacterized protein LOC126738413 n=1 Tax=Anthonomus grandis grandis TaxID=2921223 RepID=UPI002165E979|nr:uncharacterized protein LOC126738413 [Anthonomus grandis grandis]
MTLKEFCLALQTCAEKLDEEIRYNINEFNNKMFGKEMTETKLALERAKDYHYKEIVDALTEIVKNVNVILFHQEKVEWLSNEQNFSEHDLKRFSYVKRQVYAFSKQQPQPTMTRSVENLSATQKVSKQKRRTVSEISVGTLEAWEKYLDQKEQKEVEVQEKLQEVKKSVPKRTLSNARARKKFVSSTLGGFLDNDWKRKTLDSIEELNIDEKNLANCLSEESSDFNESCDSLNISCDMYECEPKINQVIGERFADRKLENINQYDEEAEETLISEEFFNDDLKEAVSNERIKPRIVDVIYKKNILPS